MAKAKETVVLEASKPANGAFIKFDSENQAEIRIWVDASQRLKVEELLTLEHGCTFKLLVARG